MGRSKKLEKISNANNIKTTCEYVYNLISYRWIDFWLFIPWFEAFTIQKRQIKLKIHNPWPKIRLETKFQQITFKNCWYHLFQYAVFKQSFSKIVIFDFRFEFLGLIRSWGSNFMNLGQKLRSNIAVFLITL